MAGILIDNADNLANDMNDIEVENDVDILLGLDIPVSPGEPFLRLLGIELPCTTWSRGRGHGNGPPAIRSNEFVMGYPQGLRPCDQKKVDQANEQFHYAIKSVRRAISRSIPGYIFFKCARWF